MEELTLIVWDYVALGNYVGILLLIAIISVCKSNGRTTEGYFLGDHKLSWIGIGASLFASSMGIERIITLAGGGATTGLAAGATEVLALPFLLVLGWVFAPVYIASSVFTLPQYIHRRFGGQRMRILLVIIYLVLYIGVRVSVNLYACSIVLQYFFPDWVIYPVIIGMLVLVALYTVPGGLRTVIHTQIFQTIVVIGGSAFLAVYAYIEVGGYANLQKRYRPTVTMISNDSYVRNGEQCGYPKESTFKMLREAGGSDMPWAAFLFGYSSNALWLWCADQLLVQKTLSARSLSHAQGGCILAGYLKILPLFLIVIPGIISRALYSNVIGCATAEQCLAMCGNPHGCSDIAYPKLMLGLLPKGLHGLLFTVMLAAAMGDLSSIFNSASTLITVDITGGLNNHLKNRWTIASARISTILMLVVCFAWLPAVHYGVGLSDLFTSILKVQFGFAPSIAAVFLLAIIWPRANEKGSFCALLVGIILGIAHIVCNIIFTEPACGDQDERPMLLIKDNNFYVTLIIFAVTVIVDVVISLCTDEPENVMLLRTTYWSRHNVGSRIRKSQHVANKFLLEEGYDSVGDSWLYKSKWSRYYDNCCGYRSYVVTPERRSRNSAVNSDMNYRSLLEQRSCMKVFLNINFVIILLVAIGMFSYFSILDFIEMY
ncbi:sodium/mannose cotransporter SLC5A10-like [Asterias amurensis]|uniref:sodium/mannose cotransporter SLC5A10-like n=1 Tax=Asterias amurensis TaxID=7602 RepID=UPI003AB42DC0